VGIRRCPIHARQAGFKNVGGRRWTHANWVPLLSALLSTTGGCQIVLQGDSSSRRGLAMLRVSTSAGGVEAVVCLLGHLAVVVIGVCHDSFLTPTLTMPRHRVVWRQRAGRGSSASSKGISFSHNHNRLVSSTVEASPRKH
jgi:hypothetical protein